MEERVMRIQTFSIIVGGSACNARCPFCVSRMTGKMEDVERRPGGVIELEGYGVCQDPTFDKLDCTNVNWRNFEVACQLAKQAGATTAMLTGKGEPTLWPNLITNYLDMMRADGAPMFPVNELQTNGIAIARGHIKDKQLEQWYKAGLTTVGISIAHHDPAVNKKIYLGDKRDYPDLGELIKRLHGIGFSVRLCCVGILGYIDVFSKLVEVVEFGRRFGVEQITLTPINCPTASDDVDALEWTRKHQLGNDMVQDMRGQLDLHGTRLLELAHGAIVYDLDGQNVCLSNCLNQGPADLSQLRNLIFHPDGHLRFRWDKKGAIIL
jgi:MoaA/NifB/PqqE/SkfB family radical SAM enzyme